MNWFQHSWDLGYRGLLPVVPPDGGISEAGKRPGVLTPAGWSGRGSKDFRATLETITAWASWGAGCGFSCNGTGILGVDIDCLDAGISEKIEGLAFWILGATSVRIGRAPKRLLVYRCAPETKYRQVRFDDGRQAEPDSKGRLIHKDALVELLAGDSKWFVAWGVHPDTKKPYAWPDGLRPLEKLPYVSAERVQALFDRLARELPKAVSSGSSGVDRENVDQEALKGDPVLVAQAMTAIPNEALDYNGVYLPMAAAVRGACQDDPDLGCGLFVEWAEKLVEHDPRNRNGPDRVYWSLKPPFGVGAGYIYDQAHKAGWTGFVDLWFDEEAAAAAVAEAVKAEAARKAAMAESWEGLVEAWLGREPSVVRFTAENFIGTKEAP